MKLSLFDSPSDIDTAVADTTRAEAAGFRRYWNPQVMHADTIRTELEAYKAAGTTEVALDILGAREAIAPLLGIALGLWGLITQVVRRGAFGIAVVAVSVLVLIGVPLADLEPWRGTSLWVSVTVIGVIAVTVAASIEQSRDRIERVRRRLDEMIEGWERRGSSILALEEGARAEDEVGHHASGKDVDVPSA